MIVTRGRVVIVGNRGSIELNPRAIMSKDAVVTGLTNWNATPKEFAVAHAAIIAGMERCGYKPEVGKELPLGDASRAHEAVMKPGGACRNRGQNGLIPSHSASACCGSFTR